MCRLNGSSSRTPSATVTAEHSEAVVRQFMRAGLNWLGHRSLEYQREVRGMIQTHIAVIPVTGLHFLDEGLLAVQASLVRDTGRRISISAAAVAASVLHLMRAMTMALSGLDAIEFLTKPFRDQDFLDAVNVGLARDRERRERRNTERAPGAIRSAHVTRACNPDSGGHGTLEQADRGRPRHHRNHGERSIAATR